MAEKDKNPKPDKAGNIIIIKKIIKKSEAGAHGGSWKVAYADFVTAMMAFFLLMWLINMTASKTKEGIANYFSSYSIFQSAKGAAIDMGYNSGEDKQNTILATDSEQEGKAKEKVKSGEEEMTKADLKSEIEAKLTNYKDQIKVVVLKDGVRIEIMDNEGKAIFPLGSSILSTNGKIIFGGICECLQKISNKIVIEGHTDALSYSSNKYTNWELSTDRASAARSEMHNDGIDPDRLVMVAGYAATNPIIKGNPSDPRNRRISILVVYPEKQGNSDSFKDLMSKELKWTSNG